MLRTMREVANTRPAAGVATNAERLRDSIPGIVHRSGLLPGVGVAIARARAGDSDAAGPEQQQRYEAGGAVAGGQGGPRPQGDRVDVDKADEYVYAALRAGASGFLLKDTPPADLLNAIRVVAAGEALLAPTVTRRLISEFARRPRPGHIPAPELTRVTGREREVLTLVGQGLANQEIAEHLHISLATARTHVGHLLTKLTARDRAQLVITAYETGLVAPRTPPA